MKIVTIKMDLVIDEDLTKVGDIVDYLNKKLYEAPEFFGDFGEENIDKITTDDGVLLYESHHGYCE
jgi:hypothetical protein